MATADYHRHDMDDRTWALPGPHLPGRRGQWGGIAEDNRRFADAALWVPGTGAPGVTCRPTTAGGRTRTDASADGGTSASGSGCPGSWPASPTPGGSWWTRPTPRCTTTAPRRRAGARAWVAQKGARHEDTPGRRCAWYASRIPCRAWYLGGSRVCCRADQGVRRRRAAAEAHL